jgi:hypothetical protein
MKKEITWTLSTGKEAKVTIELITKETIWADGDNVTIKCCKMAIVAEVEGHGCVGTTKPNSIPKNDRGLVAAIGKLGINRENLDKINAAIAEIEATPEWQAKIKGMEIAARESAEYEAHRAKMRKVMGY